MKLLKIISVTTAILCLTACADLRNAVDSLTGANDNFKPQYANYHEADVINGNEIGRPKGRINENNQAYASNKKAETTNKRNNDQHQSLSEIDQSLQPCLNQLVAFYKDESTYIPTSDELRKCATNYKGNSKMSTELALVMLGARTIEVRHNIAVDYKKSSNKTPQATDNTDRYNNIIEVLYEFKLNELRAQKLYPTGKEVKLFGVVKQVKQEDNVTYIECYLPSSAYFDAVFIRLADKSIDTAASLPNYASIWVTAKVFHFENSNFGTTLVFDQGVIEGYRDPRQ